MWQGMCRITVGQLFFELAHQVTVNSGWKNFTDTCVIEMPRKVNVGAPPFLYKQTKLNTLIKRGDKVKVELAYDRRWITRFEGYVSFVKPTFPVRIECEDAMFLLKQTSVAPKSFTGGHVKDVLDYIGVKQHMQYEVLGDITLVGDWKIGRDHDTAAKVLKKLKDDYNLASFIRGGKLVVGDPYDTTYAKHVNFSFGKNIISHDLEYRRAEDVKLKVKAISKNLKGKDLTVTVGDTTGDAESRTLHFYNKTESELRALATADLDKLKYTGYRGKFTAFGEPVVRHGDIAVLKDPEEKEKDGSFWIDGVETTWGLDGYRQRIELGKKA